MQLLYKLNTDHPQPTDTLQLYCTLKNIFNSPLYIKNVILTIPWQNRPQIRSIDKILNNPTQGWFGIAYNYCNFDFSLPIPQTVIGLQSFKLSVTYFQFLPNNQWGKSCQHDVILPINVVMIPRYTAFIPRSIRPQEARIPNEISQTIRKYFNTLTVGLEVQAGNRPLEQVIGENIQSSDIIFAIATKRDRLEDFSGWRTLEYLQGEIGYSYAKDKPIIVMVEKGVSLGGLANLFHPVTFDPKNITEFKARLHNALYSIVKRVEKLKRDAFWENLRRGFVEIGIPLILSLAGGVLATVLVSRALKSPDNSCIPLLNPVNA